MDKVKLEARINHAARHPTTVAADVDEGRFGARMLKIKLLGAHEQTKTVPATLEQIDMVLSNVVTHLEFEDNEKKVKIHSAAVICDEGIGKLYDVDDTSVAFQLDPYLCAEVEIFGDSDDFNIKEDVVPHDDGINFFIHMGEREFFYLLHLIGAGNLCIMTVNAELCVVDHKRYIRMHRNQHVHPKVKFRFLNNFVGLPHSTKEILERINSNTKIAVELKR